MNYAEVSLKKNFEWKGKIEITCRTPVDSKDALSLAYTPGVAQPCLEIQKNTERKPCPVRMYEMTVLIIMRHQSFTRVYQ